MDKDFERAGEGCIDGRLDGRFASQGEAHGAWRVLGKDY